MKSQRSLSSLENQLKLSQTAKKPSKPNPNDETFEKSTEISRSSSKKLKLRDYLYVNQLKQKNRLLSRNNPSKPPLQATFMSFNRTDPKNTSTSSIIKHKRQKIQNQVILRDVQQDINEELNVVIDTVHKLKGLLDSLTKGDICENLMVDLYQTRHKLKYNVIPQLTSCEKKIKSTQEENRQARFEKKHDGKISESQSTELADFHYQSKQESKQESKKNQNHKVCMMKRRETYHI